MLNASELFKHTGSTELFEQAKRAEGALQLYGVPKEPVDFYFVLDTSRSTAGERGIDPDTKIPNGEPDLMKGVLTKAVVLGALLDPNDQCGAIAIGTRPVQLPAITPDDWTNWYDQHMPQVGGRTNLGAAMQLTLKAIAQEQDVPELGRLAAKLPRRDTPDERLQRITLKNPVTAVVIIEGDPTDGDLVERVLHATRFIAIRWVLAFVSNERAGLHMLQSMRQVSPNVHLAEFPRGMAQVEDPRFYSEVLDGQGTWLNKWRLATTSAH